MISPLRKPGRYGLSGRGCLPGHLALAHCGGNSSNSLSKDLDRVRRHWQGPCWVAVVVDAEVWELKLPRSVMAGCRGRAAPPRAALFGCCRCARARDRRAMPPVQGVLGVLKEPALGGALRHFGVGLECAIWRLVGSESSFEVAGAGTRRARRFSMASLSTLESSEARRPCRPRCYG